VGAIVVVVVVVVVGAIVVVVVVVVVGAIVVVVVVVVVVPPTLPYTNPFGLTAEDPSVLYIKKCFVPVPAGLIN
jgi:hypothetical protein